MDTLIKKYRTRHKKCKWCKYCELQKTYLEYGVPDFYTCILKDKIIQFESLPRLCKYYRLEEKELVVPTEEYKKMIENTKIFIGGEEYERDK